MRRLLIAQLLVSSILLVGCTASFTYNRLNWLIPWYVDGYVDLTREQRKALAGQLEPILQWHRREELLRYVAILDRIERDLTAPLTAAAVQQWIDEIVAAIERTEHCMLDVALDFGATLDDEQMAEFVAELWKRQRDYEEEYLPRDDAEYRRDSYENLRDLLRRFVGRLERQQEDTLRAAARELRRFDGAWLEERTLWLQTLEPLLLQRRAGWEQAVRTSYAARKAERTPRYREYLAHNLNAISGAIAEVLNQVTGKQRNHLAREIDGLRTRLLDLSAAPRQAADYPPAAASPITWQ